MTNHEAIETLKANYPDACFEQLREAVDTAIFALQRSTHKALDTISRQAAIDEIRKCRFVVDAIEKITDLPPAQPERLTDDDFETIRIHLSAYKEKLCNQHRWKEAEEYQRIIDRFMSFASAQPEIIRCKECRHRIVNNHYGERGYLKIKGYCELDTGDPFELGRDAGNDDWFCADAERGEPQHGSD